MCKAKVSDKEPACQPERLIDHNEGAKSNKAGLAPIESRADSLTAISNPDVIPMRIRSAGTLLLICLRANVAAVALRHLSLVETLEIEPGREFDRFDNYQNKLLLVATGRTIHGCAL